MAGRVITRIPGPEWAALFSPGFTRSAFRLETLQHYSMADEQEPFRRFCAGLDPQLDLSWWTGLASTHAAAGHAMSRVRVIVEPPTDYTRFELHAYPAMVAAGDDIRVISVTPGTWPEGLPQHDFWLFDDRDTWLLNYDRAGTLLSAEQAEDPDVISLHLRWRDAALDQAIPVSEYLGLTRRRQS
jgi:hypothetical protein